MANCSLDYAFSGQVGINALAVMTFDPLGKPFLADLSGPIRRLVCAPKRSQQRILNLFE